MCLYVPLKKVVVTDGPVLKLYDISHCWETDLISLRASGGSEEARKVHTPTPTRRNFNSGLRRESETELVDAQPTPKDTAELLLNGHDGEILWCEFASGSSNNRYPLLASCGTDNTVRIWDLNVIENHTDHGNTSNIVNATSASKPEIISQTPKVARSVSVSLQLINTLKGHTGAVKYCRFAPNDLQDLIASASEDRTVRIWSVSKGIHLQILEHSSDISFLCWSHAGVSKDCIISMDQNKLGVWQKLPQGGGQLCFSLLDNFELVPGTKATGGMISPDGETLAIGFSDGNVEIWDLQKVMKKAFSATCKLSCLTGHSGAITSLCYSSDSKTLLTAANDSVLLWSTEPTEIGVTLLPPYVVRC